VPGLLTAVGELVAPVVEAGPDTPWPLIAREPALDRLENALVGTAPIGVAIVHGAAGTGKSRLVSELVGRLRLGGRVVDAINTSAALGVVPGGALSPLLGAMPLTTAAPDATELFRMFQRAVTRRSPERPLILVVDTIDHLDPTSQQLIAQLVTTRAAQLVATLGEGEALPDPIAQLWHPDTFLRVELDPLTSSEVDELLTASLRGPVSHHTSIRLHLACQGNPRNLRDLVLAATHAGSLEYLNGTWQLTGPVPSGPAVHELLRNRIRHLNTLSRDTLDRVGLCEPLPLRELTAPGAQHAAAELEQLGLITSSTAGGRISLAMANPQYRIAVRESISPLRARILLLEQAETLSRAMTPDSDMLRLLRWLMTAGEPIDPGQAETVGALAYGAGDFATTVALVDAVPESERTARAQAVKAQALRRLGRTSEAAQVLEAALRTRTDDDEVTGELVSLLALTRSDLVSGISSGLDTLDERSADLPPLVPAILAARWYLLYYAEQVDEALQVLEDLRPTGSDPAERARFDLSIALPLVSAGRTVEAVAAARRAVEFTSTSPDHSTLIDARSTHLVLAVTLFQAGELVPARSAALTTLTLATEVDDEITARYATFLLGRIDLTLGRLSSAQRWFRDVASVSLTRGPIAFRRPAVAGLTLALLEQGDLEGARAAFAELEASTGDRDFLITHVRAWMSAAQGPTDRALEQLVVRARQAEAGGHLYIAASTLFVAVRLGMADKVSAALAALAARTDSVLITLMSDTAGAHHRQDVVALVRAADSWQALHIPVHAAETLATAAKVAQGKGLHREATALHTRAQECAGAADKAATPLLQFGGTIDPLTAREREIAALAAHGLPSTKIAEQLTLSVRTVNNHLQSVYVKLGVRSRHDLPRP